MVSSANADARRGGFSGLLTANPRAYLQNPPPLSQGVQGGSAFGVGVSHTPYCTQTGIASYIDQKTNLVSKLLIGNGVTEALPPEAMVGGRASLCAFLARSQKNFGNILSARVIKERYKATQMDFY